MTDQDTVRSALAVLEDTQIAPLPIDDAITRTEIDVSIQTAKRYPRNLTQFLSRAVGLATLSEETAASCNFSLRRGGKLIEGPSIRLAEIVASAWGNLRWGARVTQENADHLVAVGFAHDLENNVANVREVRRRILDKRGNRYNSDMIAMTANAACAIAARNAVFATVPRSYVDEIASQAKAVASGTAKTVAERRDKALDWFDSEGIERAALYAYLEIQGPDDVTPDILRELTGLRTALRDGQIQPAEIAAAIQVDDDATPAEKLKAKLGNGKAAKP